MIRISPRALGFTVGLIAAMQSEAATVTVTNTRDNLAGSLRQAIQDALPDDTIVFHLPTNDPNYDAPTKTWTITLSSAELIINKNLQIDGGNNKIIIQRSGANGTPRFRIFNVSAGTVVLSHLHIRAGNLQGITNPGGA